MIRKDGSRELPPDVKEIEWEGRKTLAHATRIVAKLKQLPEFVALSEDDIIARLRQHAPNVRLVRPPSASGRLVLACHESDDVVEVSRALTRDPAIEYAEPDFVGEIAVVPSDTRYGDQ
jgi:hypothetical protein